MSIYPPSISRCEHLKVNGTQCGSPALRRCQFCFFHKSWHETRIIINGNRARRPRFVLNLPVLEDADSIQVSLMQIMRGILAGQLDPKTAGLLLYALQTASSNLSRTRFEPLHKEEIVIDPRTVDQTQLGEDVWSVEEYEDEAEVQIEASAELEIESRNTDANMERTINEIEGADEAEAEDEGEGPIPQLNMLRENAIARQPNRRGQRAAAPEPEMHRQNAIARRSPAAKRRKNAAHGASRGWKPENGQAPEERKKNCDNVEADSGNQTIAEIKAVAVGNPRKKRSAALPRRRLSLVAARSAPDRLRVKPERRTRRSHAIN